MCVHRSNLKLLRKDKKKARRKSSQKMKGDNRAVYVEYSMHLKSVRSSKVEVVVLFCWDYRRSWVIWSVLSALLLKAGLFYSHSSQSLSAFIRLGCVLVTQVRHVDTTFGGLYTKQALSE